MRFSLIVVSAVLLASSALAADVRDQLVGHWVGESICTPAHKACHDEIASYHITKKEGDPKVVALLANKIVNGQEVEMGGVMDFVVDAAKQTLTADFRFKTNHIVIKLHWDGKKMAGTLVDGDNGDVVRNISVAKK